MKQLYTIIIIVGIIAEIILLTLFDKKVVVYGPIIFWMIGLFILLVYGANIFKLSKSVARTNPKLYKKHSFGIMLTQNALSDKNFLSH